MTPAQILTDLNHKLNAKFRVSRRNVPYLSLWYAGACYHVAYFGKGKKYRVFTQAVADPDKQDRIDFYDQEEVLKFFGRVPKSLP